MRALALTVPLIAALALTACGQAPQQPPIAVGWANQSTPLTPPAMLTFGQTHTWPGGDTITVSSPRRMAETPSAIDGRAGTFIVVDVTVRNGGRTARSALDYLTMATINDRSVDYAAMRGHEDLVFSSASIAPGGTLTWSQAYPVPDATPVRFQVQAMGSQFDPTRPVVFFQGTV